jgi:hypothetical protein
MMKMPSTSSDGQRLAGQYRALRQEQPFENGFQHTTRLGCAFHPEISISSKQSTRVANLY